MASIIDFANYDGLGLAELVRRKDISAKELLDAAIARVDATNPVLNAIITRMDEHGRAAIASGLPSGPFTGVPYLLKDLGALYTGSPPRYGTALFTGHPA